MDDTIAAMGNSQLYSLVDSSSPVVDDGIQYSIQESWWKRRYVNQVRTWELFFSELMLQPSAPTEDDQVRALRRMSDGPGDCGCGACPTIYK